MIRRILGKLTRLPSTASISPAHQLIETAGQMSACIRRACTAEISRGAYKANYSRNHAGDDNTGGIISNLDRVDKVGERGWWVRCHHLCDSQVSSLSNFRVALFQKSNSRQFVDPRSFIRLNQLGRLLIFETKLLKDLTELA